MVSRRFRAGDSEVVLSESFVQIGHRQVRLCCRLLPYGYGVVVESPVKVRNGKVWFDVQSCFILVIRQSIFT